MKLVARWSYDSCWFHSLVRQWQKKWIHQSLKSLLHLCGGGPVKRREAGMTNSMIHRYESCLPILYRRHERKTGICEWEISSETVSKHRCSHKDFASMLTAHATSCETWSRWPVMELSMMIRLEWLCPLVILVDWMMQFLGWYWLNWNRTFRRYAKLAYSSVWCGTNWGRPLSLLLRPTQSLTTGVATAPPESMIDQSTSYHCFDDALYWSRRKISWWYMTDEFLLASIKGFKHKQSVECLMSNEQHRVFRGSRRISISFSGMTPTSVGFVSPLRK